MSSSSDRAAVVIAIISAAVATLSLIVSYRAYRRSGARVRLIFESRKFGSAYPPRDEDQELAIRVINKGMAPIQIIEWRLEERMDWQWSWIPLWFRAGSGPSPWTWLDLAFVPENHGPPVPYTLEGYHEGRWIIKTTDCESRGSKSHRAIWRAVVVLGTGKAIRASSVFRRYPERGAIHSSDY
jgi:hypothetical protein